MDATEVVDAFREPTALWTRAQLLAKPSPIPPENGIYAWYFDELSLPAIPQIGTRVGPWSLLYVGIAPGRPGSGSNLRKRLRNHLSGNARGSTLRLSLGCLLAERLGLLPVAASGKLHFGRSEAALSAWLEAHTRVTWAVVEEPWNVEVEVVRALRVPLNRNHNDDHPFHSTMGTFRRSLRETLKLELPGM